MLKEDTSFLLNICSFIVVKAYNMRSTLLTIFLYIQHSIVNYKHDVVYCFPQWLFAFILTSLLIFIGVQLLYNIVLVSTVQQSESAICIHISTLFQIPFPYRSLQSIEQSSLCYTAGSYQLSILRIVVYICQSQSPNLSLPPLSPW